MCQNPLFNRITLATDICDRGDFHIFGVLTHPPGYGRLKTRSDERRAFRESEGVKDRQLFLTSGMKEPEF